MIIKHKGIDVFFEDQGKGQSIILLHGFLENASMWEDLKKELIKKNRVITIDLLGHGNTGCIGYLHLMEDMAKAVDAVIRGLRLRRLILIGHSMGGYVSLAYSKLFSKKVKGLCLMNSTAKADSRKRIQLRNDAIAYAKKRYAHLINVSIENLFNPNTKSNFKKDIEFIKKAALKTPLQGYIAAQEGMKIRPNLESQTLSPDFKTMYIIGKQDPILDYRKIIKEAQKSKSYFKVLEAGHMVHVEAKKEFTYNIIRFIENI